MTVDPYDRPIERVLVFDTTLRDGEQAPGFSMSVAAKLRMAHALDTLGADIVEAGFPVASSGDFDAVCAIAEAVRRPTIAALARAVPADIERAWKAVRTAARPRIHVFLATSDLHLRVKLRLDRAGCLARIVESVALARSLCSDVEFSAEDATRSDLGFLTEVAEAAVEAGASTINLPDTVGYALPGDITRMFQAIGNCVGDRARLSAHCHDDLGLAVANTLAAVEAGARQVECTMNGIGERAGNAALEEVVMALSVRHDRLPYETAIHTPALVPTSRALAEVVAVRVAPNKAIVGDNAFAHEAGIHQDGMLKHAMTYEIMRPETVGADRSRLVLGKHSGTRGVDARCRELGYRLSASELERVYRGLIARADEVGTIDDGTLAAVIADAAGQMMPPPMAERRGASGSEVSA